MIDDRAGEIILKLVNATAQTSNIRVDPGTAGSPKPGTLPRLQADRLDATNTFDAPEHVAPKAEPFAPTRSAFDLSLPANSFTVLRVALAR